MSTTSPPVKARGAGSKRSTTPAPETLSNDIDAILERAKKGATDAVVSEWDYKLAFGIITVLAFVTRFYGIQHPDQVVFDEVHFGKASRVMEHDTTSHRR